MENVVVWTGRFKHGLPKATHQAHDEKGKGRERWVAVFDNSDKKKSPVFMGMLQVSAGNFVQKAYTPNITFKLKGADSIDPVPTLDKFTLVAEEKRAPAPAAVAAAAAAVAAPVAAAAAAAAPVAAAVDVRAMAIEAAKILWPPEKMRAVAIKDRDQDFLEGALMSAENFDVAGLALRQVAVPTKYLAGLQMEAGQQYVLVFVVNKELLTEDEQARNLLVIAEKKRRTELEGKEEKKRSPPEGKEEKTDEGKKNPLAALIMIISAEQPDGQRLALYLRGSPNPNEYNQTGNPTVVRERDGKLVVQNLVDTDGLATMAWTARLVTTSKIGGQWGKTSNFNSNRNPYNQQFVPKAKRVARRRAAPKGVRVVAGNGEVYHGDPDDPVSAMDLWINEPANQQHFKENKMNREKQEDAWSKADDQHGVYEEVFRERKAEYDKAVAKFLADNGGPAAAGAAPVKKKKAKKAPAGEHKADAGAAPAGEKNKKKPKTPKAEKKIENRIKFNPDNVLLDFIGFKRPEIKQILNLKDEEKFKDLIIYEDDEVASEIKDEKTPALWVLFTFAQLDAVNADSDAAPRPLLVAQVRRQGNQILGVERYSSRAKTWLTLDVDRVRGAKRERRPGYLALKTELGKTRIDNFVDTDDLCLREPTERATGRADWQGLNDPRGTAAKKAAAAKKPAAAPVPVAGDDDPMEEIDFAASSDGEIEAKDDENEVDLTADSDTDDEYEPDDVEILVLRQKDAQTKAILEGKEFDFPKPDDQPSINIGRDSYKYIEHAGHVLLIVISEQQIADRTDGVALQPIAVVDAVCRNGKLHIRRLYTNGTNYELFVLMGSDARFDIAVSRVKDKDLIRLGSAKKPKVLSSELVPGTVRLEEFPPWESLKAGNDPKLWPVLLEFLPESKDNKLHRGAAAAAVDDDMYAHDDVVVLVLRQKDDSVATILEGKEFDFPDPPDQPSINIDRDSYEYLEEVGAMLLVVISEQQIEDRTDGVPLEPIMVAEAFCREGKLRICRVFTNSTDYELRVYVAPNGNFGTLVSRVQDEDQEILGRKGKPTVSASELVPGLPDLKELPQWQSLRAATVPPRKPVVLRLLPETKENRIHRDAASFSSSDDEGGEEAFRAKFDVQEGPDPAGLPPGAGWEAYRDWVVSVFRYPGLKINWGKWRSKLPQYAPLLQ